MSARAVPYLDTPEAVADYLTAALGVPVECYTVATAAGAWPVARFAGRELRAPAGWPTWHALACRAMEER